MTALLVRALRDPGTLAGLDLGGWDLLVRQARAAGLLARVALLAEAAPEAPRRHLAAALALADKQRRDVWWELHCLRRALEPCGCPLIALKGAAYVAAGLPPGECRGFGDIDLLVPRRLLATAEAALAEHGWETTTRHPYDNFYYRHWMHEVPPLRHVIRGTVVDLHHAVAPPLTHPGLDSDTLIDAARPAGGRWSVLAPADMVLHSALHLFDEGAPARALRDLDDIARLLARFSAEPGFWRDLPARADRFGIRPALDRALAWASRLLGAPVPPALLRPTAAAPIFERLLRPDHASCRDRWTRPALGLLYLRAHLLRLPLGLLVPHLLRKAVRAVIDPQATMTRSRNRPDAEGTPASEDSACAPLPPSSPP